jgi:4-amino-4-deoxy-L-arabinose transferase-like glycosyltransferase
VEGVAKRIKSGVPDGQRDAYCAAYLLLDWKLGRWFHLLGRYMQMKPTLAARPPSGALGLSRPSRFVCSLWWQYLALALILLLSAVLNFWHLNQLGFGNRFYAAGVRSMLDSWHNFFFVSFDPGGFVAIDKPPLGLWIQVLSVKLFGFSGLSMLLPEALAGVVSVAVLYHLVARVFGAQAGLLAALGLAVSPLSVVISRNNTMDMLLVCVILFATWTIFLATETGRLSWLLTTALLIGLGFNIKALEAYLVVPAFGLLYLLCAPHPWRKRGLHLLLATGLLLVVSLLWITIVDLVPASQRPYVGSTTDDSELSLALGYNGLHRLFGSNSASRHPMIFASVFNYADVLIAEANAARDLSASDLPGLADAHDLLAAPQASTAGEKDAIGKPGPLRLFGPDLSGQVSWLLPLALVGLLAASWRGRWRLPLTRQQQSLALWAGCFATMAVFFSVANSFNIYYLVILDPSIAALAGIGMAALWRDYRLPGWRAWLLPLALLIAAGMQTLFLLHYPGFAPVLAPIVLEVCVPAAFLLAVARLIAGRAGPQAGPAGIAGAPWFEPLSRPPVLRAVVMLAFLALLIAPSVWGSYSVLGTLGIQRAAGPQPQTTIQTYFAALPNLFAPAFTPTPGLSRLERYLIAHRGQAAFIVATVSSDLAAPIILATNQPVMALGGFAGNDSILTTQRLVALIDHGTIRFFLLQFPSMKTKNDTLLQWVSAHCQQVFTSEWASGRPPPNETRAPNGQELLDCANHL